jgi:hypothetical protein
MTRLALVGTCALLLVAGCGGDDDAAGGGSTPTPTATETATAPPEETAAATATPSEAVAVKEVTIDGKPVRLELVSLRRTGELTELELRLTNAQDPDEASGETFQASGLFDGPETDDEDTLDGIYLVDPVNRKKYPVAKDSEGMCVCSDSSGLLAAGDETALTATFGAPPEDVTQVDVSVPEFGTFRDVAIG